MQHGTLYTFRLLLRTISSTWRTLLKFCIGKLEACSTAPHLSSTPQCCYRLQTKRCPGTFVSDLVWRVHVAKEEQNCVSALSENSSGSDFDRVGRLRVKFCYSRSSPHQIQTEKKIQINNSINSDFFCSTLTVAKIFIITSNKLKISISLTLVRLSRVRKFSNRIFFFNADKLFSNRMT